ncbi:ATP-grasp domain-containing protein [Streptomyces sp. NBC_01298]|uniref:ATP-grasp domain-containing protein n=1 Tax=Streptomyces sp. NBC_01298 TaxID=2903817 RepID=UPI002E10352D|nr:ATP-grasp domain-containing protein [Streptomyces sp. NBC_01298]
MREAQPTAVLLNPRDTVVSAAHDLGLAVIVVADPSQPKPPAVNAAVLESSWTASSADLVRQLRELALPGPVSCFGFGEIGCSVAAVVNQELGWPGNPPQALAAFTNKAELRALVGEQAGKPVAHVTCFAEGTLLSAIETIGFPCVVKPIDGTGSSGVRFLAGRPEAERYAQETEFSGPLLVEEFLAGAEYSVEAMSDGEGHRILAITEKMTTGAPHFVETGHTLPVGLTAADEAAVTDLVTAMLDAVGYRYGPSHTEIMITTDGPRLIESHGRPGGDRISDMLVLALGEDVFAQTMAAVFGMPVPAEPAHRRVAGIRYVTFDGAVPMLELSTALVASLPGVEEVHIAVPAGQLPPRISESGDRHAFVVAVADSRAELETRLDCALRTLTAHG